MKTIQPLPLFSWKTLAAGLYLAVPLSFAFAVLFFIVMFITVHLPWARWIAPYRLYFILAIVLLILWPWINSIARQWAQKTHGRPLEQGVSWGILWRSTIITSLTAVADDAVERLVDGQPPSARLLSYVVKLVLFLVDILAIGWAMSVMVAKRLNQARAERSSA